MRINLIVINIMSSEEENNNCISAFSISLLKLEITMRRSLALIALIVTPSFALAQQADPTATTRGLIPFILAGMIAYVTRRMAIGGWLFYFYIVLMLSPIVSVTFAYSVIGYYFQPSLWNDSKTYWLSFFSYLPWLASLTMVFMSATRLIFPNQRNRANAMFLRYSLVALVVTGLIGLIIDLMYFPENAILSGISTVCAILLCLYFFVSKRVKYVFDNWSGKWSYEDFVNSVSARASEW